jgi:hypothetical protein
MSWAKVIILAIAETRWPEEVGRSMPLDRLVDSGQQITPPPDVQRTTLGLDALSRFICNTWEEATAKGTRRFDAIVIGAGMFGGYCANKYIASGKVPGSKSWYWTPGHFSSPLTCRTFRVSA